MTGEATYRKLRYRLTGVKRIEGCWNEEYEFKVGPKRNAYGKRLAGQEVMPDPKAVGFDRFGLDCLAFLAKNYSMGGSPRQMADTFETVCQVGDYSLDECRIDYEELRMLAVFAVPMLLWYGLFGWLGVGKMGDWYLFAALFFPLIVGWRMHLDLSQALDDSVPINAIYATTFLTRHGLTRADIKNDPTLISTGVDISANIQRVIKHYLYTKVNSYHSSWRNSLPCTTRFNLPAMPGTSRNPYWGEWIRPYNAVANARMRGNYSHAAAWGVAAAAGTAWAADSVTSHDQYHVPDFGPYATGVDNLGLPQVNVDGIPMIADSGVDIYGGAYGTPHDS